MLSCSASCSCICRQILMIYAIKKSFMLTGYLKFTVTVRHSPIVETTEIPIFPKADVI